MNWCDIGSAITRLLSTWKITASTKMNLIVDRHHRAQKVALRKYRVRIANHTHLLRKLKKWLHHHKRVQLMEINSKISSRTLEVFQVVTYLWQRVSQRVSKTETILINLMKFRSKSQIKLLKKLWACEWLDVDAIKRSVALMVRSYQKAGKL